MNCYGYRHNIDEELRHYHYLDASGGDVMVKAKSLNLRIRASDLDPHHVRLAAHLGDEASLLLFPGEPEQEHPRRPGVELGGGLAKGFLIAQSLSPSDSICLIKIHPQHSNSYATRICKL